MSSLFIAAAVIELLTGVIHSVMGERLIFRPLRGAAVVPHLAAPPLHERHIRILWASWHALSVFGWACAGMLAYHGVQGSGAQGGAVDSAVLTGIVGANAVSALLVLVGTRGRHPGWIALSAVAALTAAGM